MKKQMMIRLPAREDIPETSIYTKIYSKNERLGERDIMLLVPGGPGNDHTLYIDPSHSIVDALFSYTDIILFDPRGCGQSEASPVEYCSLSHYIDDIEAIRQYFKIPAQQFILFGQSYGSIASLGYAIRYHANLSKLLLIGGAASSECLQQAQHNLSTRGTAQQQKLGEKIWSGSFSGEPEENAEFYQVMGPLYANSFQPGGPIPPITYNVEVLNFGFSDFLKKFDYRAQLAQICCPTLILWGADDWLFDIQQAEILRQHIANCQLLVYQQCSHLLWLDQWERFVKDSAAFLTNIDS